MGEGDEEEESWRSVSSKIEFKKNSSLHQEEVKAFAEYWSRQLLKMPCGGKLKPLITGSAREDI